MKRIKISLAVVAFVFAAGSAVATSTAVQTKLADCSGVPAGGNPNNYPTPATAVCPLPEDQQCCLFEGTLYFERI